MVVLRKIPDQVREAVTPLVQVEICHVRVIAAKYQLPANAETVGRTAPKPKTKKTHTHMVNTKNT